MLHFPSSKKIKFYEIKLSFAIMNNYIQNDNVKSNQINKEQKHKFNSTVQWQLIPRERILDDIFSLNMSDI